jgi:hypothetical protein
VRKPSPPQYRHIVHIANGQLRGTSSRKGLGSAGRVKLVAFFLTIAAMHQGNYATIANYLERELRYMDAGE